MCQPLIKFHPHPAIITQVLSIFVENNNTTYNYEIYIMERQRTACVR